MSTTVTLQTGRLFDLSLYLSY